MSGILNTTGAVSGILGTTSAPAVGTGTDGYVLTATGAGVEPAWEAASSADVVLLSTTNFTSSTATVSFDGFFSATYKNYQIIASNITLVSGTGTPSVNAQYRISDSAATASNYVVVGIRYYAVDDNLTKLGLSGQSEMKISNENTRATTGQNLSFLMTIYDPIATNNYVNCTFHTLSFDANLDNRHHMEIASGTYTDSTAALSGIQFAATGTNMLRGDFKLYGFK